MRPLPISVLGVLCAGCMVGCMVEAIGLGGGEDGPGAGGAGQGGAPTSTTSGDPGPEGHCLDGLDGEGDGLIDCADPDCSDVSRCVEIPAGWTLVAIEETLPGTPAGGGCPAATEPRFSGPAGPSCSVCGCIEISAGTCSAPEISCWYTGTCDGNPSWVEQLVGAACTVGNLPGIPQGASGGACRLTAPAVQLAAPQCDFTGGTVDTPPFTTDVHVCSSVESQQSSCTAGQVCVPLGHPAGRVCIRQAGADLSCPPGWESPVELFSGADDQRSCTPCTCSAVCAGGGYVVHDVEDCGDYDTPVTVTATSCTPTPNIWDFGDGSLEPIYPPASSAICGGGAPTGAVVGLGEETVCCAP